MAAQPLTAALIRSVAKPKAQAGGELTSLLAALAEVLVAALKSFTAVPIRVEPDGLSIVSHQQPVPGGVAIRLASARGNLSPVLLADRALVMALCEASFGGNGTEPPYDGGERPYSPVERRLMNEVLAELGMKLPDALELCFALQFRKPEEELRRPPPRQAAVSYYAGRLLVYVFGYSGELTVLLPEEEIARITAPAGPGDSAGDGGSGRSLSEALNGAEIEVTALLPADLKPLSEVTALRPGQLLKFRSDTNTPLLLVAEGRHLHRARMSEGGEQVRIEIIE
jgi:flagellar motor switch protein FliM